jgi:hypothetical protein
MNKAKLNGKFILAFERKIMIDFLKYNFHMPNIKFNYQYRDAANYKQAGFVIFSNPENLSTTFLEEQLRKKLIDQEFFYPSNFNAPHLTLNGIDYDPNLDHEWNEFISLEETEEEANDKRSRIINELIVEGKST